MLFMLRVILCYRHIFGTYANLKETVMAYLVFSKRDMSAIILMS